MRESIKERISKHIEGHDYIQIKRKGTAESWMCIPLAISERFLMILRFYDFEPYGYEIFLVDSIASIQCSDADVFFGHVVMREGALAWIEGRPEIELCDWKTVFSFFSAGGELVTVDIGKEDCVNVGRVTGGTDTTLQMRCFSPSGVWDEEDLIEPYENITGVELRNSYLRMFAKYLPPREKTTGGTA